jgi:hypothetical protein
VRVDHDGCTSIPGVYAAGDLVPGLHLIQMAAASGTAAGVAAALSLWAEDGRVALAGGGYRADMADDEKGADARIQDLDDKIDRAREHLEDIAPAEEGDDERRFVEPGEEGSVEESPAPPG